MSDLTTCNHCSLAAIRRRAKREGKKITILADATWGLGGVNVYVHPRNVDVKKLTAGDKGSRRKYFASWFMELTTHCVC